MNNIRKQYLEFCPLQGNLLDVLADPSPHNIRDIIVPQENRKEPATIFTFYTVTGGSVGWASGCRAGSREFNSGRTNIQGLKK